MPSLSAALFFTLLKLRGPLPSLAALFKAHRVRGTRRPPSQSQPSISNVFGESVSVCEDPAGREVPFLNWGALDKWGFSWRFCEVVGKGDSWAAPTLDPSCMGAFTPDSRPPPAEPKSPSPALDASHFERSPFVRSPFGHSLRAPFSLRCSNTPFSDTSLKSSPCRISPTAASEFRAASGFRAASETCSPLPGNAPPVSGGSDDALASAPQEGLLPFPTRRSALEGGVPSRPKQGGCALVRADSRMAA
jgi:hypothetical protein